MAAAGLERHHEPPYRDIPAWVRVPGLAVRIRVPGRRPQRRIAAGAMAAGVVITALATVGLLSPGRPGYVAGAPPPVTPAPHGAWVVSAPRTAAQHVPRPVFLTIPAVGIRTPLLRLGLTVTGALQVPSTTALAGWYGGGPRPGATGPAVIGGHVDSRAGPGVFFRLHLLRPGDRVYVRQAGGRLAVFGVTAVRSYPKSRFPTAAVYGPVPTAQLRLITCGGTFDHATGHYLSNVIVFASLDPAPSP